MMKEEANLSKTGTFGAVLEEREFTEDEKTVLSHFFTNIDKNIYGATDAMPNSLWALLEGGYSRSQVSMRMRFLDIFDEMLEEFKAGKLAKEEIVTVKDFADKLRSGGSLNMAFFLSKAEQFMRKWAVQYGHDSLKDSDVVRFAIENVTQFATAPIEEARLGAYQEKSTRYVNISNEFLVVPTDLKEFENEVRSWNRLLMSNYDESKSIVNNFIAKRLNRAEFKSEAAFDRTVAAKTFDIVRYFLPATSLTSLGVV
ncbi:FAD-dependent thymidylate synthase, partial [bacterium]|nr:FAD-dependent thymidylate synthase [bacterium]